MTRKPKKTSHKVLAKAEIFCREYIIHRNATKAAIAAGYSEATAGARGSILLRNVKNQARIDELEKERLERLRLDADQILDEARKLATSDVTDLFDDEGKMKPMNEWPADLRRCVSSVEVEELFDYERDDDGRMQKTHIGYTKKIKLWDKTKALEMLGRNKKLFTDVVENKGGITLIMDEHGIGPARK